MENVFVYGSLKQGFGNNPVLGDSEFKGNGVVHGFEMQSLGGFPAIWPNDDGAIYGELYECDEHTMERLDRLEGNGSFYEREVVTIDLGPESKKVEGWVYVLCDKPREDKDRVVFIDELGAENWAKGSSVYSY